MANKKNKVQKKSVLISKRRTGKENYKKRSKKQSRVSETTSPLVELQPVNFNTLTIDGVTKNTTADTEPLAQCDDELSQNNMNDNVTINTTADKEPLSECDDELSQNNMNENLEELNNFPLIVESEKEGYQSVNGRRIVDINYLMLQLQDKSHHSDLFDCKAGYFQLIGEKRNGLISKFKFKCNMCQKIIVLDSENPENADMVNVNIAAASGIVSTGIGFSQFEELFSAMDVPVFSSNSYTHLQDIVYDKWEKVSTESMEAAANREKQAAIDEGRIKDGYALVDVYVDGAWCSRSYGNNFRANSGTAAIIGKRFGEVLYMAVKNKYCAICARAEKKEHDPKEHKCYKNYKGSSSAMEADIICEGFKASKEMYGIIYARMIGDGDSSTYAKILAAKPYDNHTVEKIECRNHILRNFCNKLRAVAKDTKYPLAHRKSLTNEKVMSMRKVIVKSIKYHKNSDTSENISITLLHNDIANSIAHAYGDHRFCSEYNCTKEKILAGSSMNQVQNSTFLFRVKAIIATAANKARSLIEDVDTNAVERFNSIVAKFVGGKRINFSSRRGYQGRCAAAVVSYNNETAISSVQKEILGKSPKGKVKDIERRRALKRKRNLEHPTKKLRKINEKNSIQHDYGPTSQSPDMTTEQFEQAKELFLDNLKNLTFNRTEIERNTILQRDSSDWMEIRKKLITASNFGPICKRQISRSTAPLVKNILYKNNLAHVSSVAHGVEHEKQALQQMELQESINIEPCGLFIDDHYPFIGATPDGLVGDDIIVEMKCPITAFKKGIDSAIKENKIQLYKFDKKNNTKSINKTSNWYYQVQGQLHVTGRHECIFGIWSGENQPLMIEHIYKDDEFWKAKMEKKIVNFYLKCLLPEIIDPRQIRGMTIRDLTLEDINENNTTNLPQQKPPIQDEHHKQTNKSKNTLIQDEPRIQHEEYDARMEPRQIGGMTLRDLISEDENVCTNLPQQNTIKYKITPTQVESIIHHEENEARMEPCELQPRYLSFDEF